jgi:hypothetical protein
MILISCRGSDVASEDGTHGGIKTFQLMERGYEDFAHKKMKNESYLGPAIARLLECLGKKVHIA